MTPEKDADFSLFKAASLAQVIIVSCRLFLQVHETLFQRRIFTSTIFWKVRQLQQCQKIKREDMYLFESTLFIISAFTFS